MDGSSPDIGGGLSAAERRSVLVAAAVPVLLALVVLGGLAVVGIGSVVDVVVGTVVYGGLLGLTTGVVAHERAQADHCPRCGAGGARATPTCAGCGYDLARRPVWFCEERHERSYEPGLCRCGRRLLLREPAPGLGRSVRRTLWAGVWLFALLAGTWLLIRLVG